MNTGKTLFAQLMDFLPWTTFTRLVQQYGGDRYVKSLTCAEQFRIMAFAQLTYRESLRDIEVCLSAQAAKLYHMGFRQEIRRATLADANEKRDWRIHAEFAQRLIAQARKLYVGDSLAFELENTAYALGAVPHNQGGGQDAYAARPARQHPQLHPHLGRQAARRSCARSADRGSRRNLRHGSRLSGLHAAVRRRSGQRLLCNSCQVEPGCTAIICDQTIGLNGYKTSRDYPAHLRRVRFKDPESGKTLVFLTNNFTLPAATICALYKSRWQVELFFKWIKQHLRIKKFFGTSENAVKSQIWIAVSVYVLVAIVKKRLNLDASLYTLLQIFSLTLFEKMPIQQVFAGSGYTSEHAVDCNQLNLFAF